MMSTVPNVTYHKDMFRVFLYQCKQCGCSLHAHNQSISGAPKLFFCIECYAPALRHTGLDFGFYMSTPCPDFVTYKIVSVEQSQAKKILHNNWKALLDGENVSEINDAIRGHYNAEFFQPIVDDTLVPVLSLIDEQPDQI